MASGGINLRSGTIRAAIAANIHSEAHWAIPDWDTFAWHRHRGTIQAHKPHSSQAFCVSVWGTLAHPGASDVRAVLHNLLDIEPGGLTPGLDLEYVDRSLLNEYGSVPTNLDAVLTYPGLVVTVESKLTEPFGGCSQVKNGAGSGRYEPGSDLKTGTAAACRLTVPDGQRTARRYFEVMNQLAGPDAITEGQPCPIAGPGYQVMRNVASAARLGEHLGTDWRAVFAFPASRQHDSVKAMESVRRLLTPANASRMLILDYDHLADQLVNIPDTRQLAEHMKSLLNHIGDMPPFQLGERP